ncbi:hypothetical protein B6U99_04875 [Candidatus Geothermarchaeota archaeon ex4572_27]|nr:MAG: hypothetical protein B6U99_04875 [Candidatus Geothermarchaeota archaeon ex4572_27]
MRPLVSVTIPTRNSARTLELCLRSIASSTYPKVEVVVVDGHSSDGTMRIAEEYGARVVPCDWGLLGARYLGFTESRGDYVLMLDSDQVLEPTAIERAVEASRLYDMLVLEELSARPRGLLERLYAYDREVAHLVPSLDPVRGEVLPRFFKRWVLERAFSLIPSWAIREVVHFDHAIIYYEAYRVTRRVGVLPRAVWHLETPTMGELVSKNLRYGRSLRALLRLRGYRRLLLRDSTPKKLANRAVYGARGGLKAALGSIALNLLKDYVMGLGLALALARL